MRPGFALLFTILLALLLSAAALGMVAVGITEIELAGAVTRRAVARTEAEALARRLFHEWATHPLADLEPGHGRSLLENGSTRAVVERVDTPLYLIRTMVRVPPGSPAGATGRASLLVRVFDPVRTARPFPAAVTVEDAASITRGTIDGRDACASGRDRPGLVVGGFLDAGSEALIHGEPPVRLEPPPPAAAPSPFAPPLVGALSTIRPRLNTVTPRPLSRGGACIEGARNWGALDPRHPCYSLLPLVFADHDLTIADGEARAVLVVEGDLRIASGVSLAGAIMARDTLTLEPGASIAGAVRAGALVMEGGVVRADPCTLDAAISAPALDAGYRPSGRWWLPAF